MSARDQTESSKALDVELCLKKGEPPSKPKNIKCAIVKQYQWGKDETELDLGLK